MLKKKTRFIINRGENFEISTKLRYKKLVQEQESAKRKKERDILYFHSPLDRIRSGINERAVSLGLQRCLDKSFELNQSFPRVTSRRVREYELDPDSSNPESSIDDKMEKLRVDGANGLRFSARRNRFTPAATAAGAGSPYNNSMLNSTSDSFLRIQKSGINPNKAVFTIDSKSSQILIVNNNACQLLGYTSKELCNMQFALLLSNKKKSHVSALAEGQLNSEDGTMVLLSGKVVEMNTKNGFKVAVSLWIRQIDNEGRCLAVAEPVERRIAELIIDQDGFILNGDYEAVLLFQLDSEDKLNGLEIKSLIPAIQLPTTNNATTPPTGTENSFLSKNIRKQKATGKTKDGVSFPLCLMFREFDTDLADKTNVEPMNLISGNNYYLITIWVFTNISGLIVIDENGVIESCNHHFSMLMFGYPETKILNQLITKIIPNFGQDLQYLGYRSRNATISSVDNESETETDPICVPVEEVVMTSTINPVITDPSPNKTNLEYTTNAVISSSIQQSNNPKGILKIIETDGSMANHESQQQQQPMEGENVEKTEEMENIKNLENTQAPSDLQLNDTNNMAIDHELLTPVNEIINEVITNLEYHHQHNKTETMISGGGGGDSLNPIDYKTDLIITPKCNKSNESTIDLEMMTSTPFAAGHTPGNDVNHSDDDILNNDCDDGGGSDELTENSGSNLTTENPTNKKQYMDGSYKGEAIHIDGNVIDIIYTISCQTLPCGRKVFCVWISRDPDSDDYDELDEDEERHLNLTLTFNSGNSQMENSLGQSIQKNAAQNSSSRPNSLSLVSQCEEEQVNGEFSQQYTTLKQIGRGAYGYVKMAYRNSDRLLVVAKFILKEKLCPQFMITTDDDNKEMPMEIYLLTTVKHANIVTVYDVFENEKFFQLVMEKHGSGMDLFEFIDRRPMMDEKLACYIFRQIAKAVDYLHSLRILHRDIKDENIIIDQNFHVKLIDFGSATFMQEGKLFSTFFGTTEYCSPEVLAGNKYAGPELEMWSLGVTLYVLIFFENPFLDIEETLRGDLRFLHHITPNLEILLTSMLDKNPKTRCTMKELMEDVWLNQDIISTNFNFVNIVRCEPYEAAPDKYYTGQKFSSTTLLSTTSPQDSLSLVDDDDSIIDGEEEEEDDDKSIPSQDQDNGFKLESLPSAGYSESLNSVSSSSQFANPECSNTTSQQSFSQSHNISSGGNFCEDENSCRYLSILDDSEKIVSSLEIISITDNLVETYDDDDYEDDDDVDVNNDEENSK